jgi:hypothetical protein
MPLSSNTAATSQPVTAGDGVQLADLVLCGLLLGGAAGIDGDASGHGGEYRSSGAP